MDTWYEFDLDDFESTMRRKLYYDRDSEGP